MSDDADEQQPDEFPPIPPRAEQTTAVCLYFQVHQPFRLRHYTFFDIGSGKDYFDDDENERIVKRVAEKCYLPMNELIGKLIDRYDGEFRCAYSISGTALEQFELWTPETVESFQRLARTGCVEFLAETRQHSLAFLADPAEFERQVRDHAAHIEELFGRRPTTFRNTELVIDNDLARRVEAMGFEGILGEGADQLLGWRSPHYVYRRPGHLRAPGKLLLRDYVLLRRHRLPLLEPRVARVAAGPPTRFAEKLDQTAGVARHLTSGCSWTTRPSASTSGTETGILDFLERACRAAVLASPRLSASRTPSEVVRAARDPVARARRSRGRSPGPTPSAT